MLKQIFKAGVCIFRRRKPGELPLQIELQVATTADFTQLFADTSVPAVDTWGTRAYSSAPNAPTEGEDVFDVFSRSTQLGLNGVAYSEW